MVVLGCRHEQGIGAGDRRLERHDRDGLAGILDILVVERDLRQLEDVDDDPGRGQLSRGPDETPVVGRSAEAAGEPQEVHVGHGTIILSAFRFVMVPRRTGPTGVA